MIKQLIIVLAIVGVVLCDDSRSNLVDLLIKTARNQAGNAQLGQQLDELMKNPAYERVVSAIANSPAANNDLAATKAHFDKLVSDIQQLVPPTSQDGSQTATEELVAGVLLMLRGPSGGF